MKQISLRASRQTAIFSAMAFVSFGFVAQYVLPARFRSDSVAMIDVAQGLISGGDPSANVISALIRIFSLPVMTFLVQAGAVGIAFYLLSNRRLLFSWAIALFSFAIASPLSLVRPQKENLVLLLTIVCVWLISKCKSHGRALFFCLIAYIIYWAISHRPYYILILGVIIGLSVFSRLSRRTKIVTVLALFATGFFIPSTVFELLRMTRDAVNDLRVLYPEIEGNRTAFSNPVEAATWIGFLENYAYAVMRLNLPILFFQTPSEVVLTLYSLSWLCVMWMAKRSGDWRGQLAVRLMMSHLLVLWIFEPDFGSYLRHFSSCILYLGPILTAIEARALRQPRGEAILPDAPLRGEGVIMQGRLLQ
jgi:hypothetical protein